jgi:hypothetical protein
LFGRFLLGVTMDYIKVCKVCQIEYPATTEYFHKQKQGKFGYRTICKKCIANNTDREKQKIYYRKYYEINKNKVIKKQLEYISNNRDKVNARHNRKYHSDINYKLKHNLKRRMNNALKGCYKTKSTIKLLGCDVKELKNHLEKQFVDGMNWKNYGKWHIDHIIPCASFDLTDPEQQKKCFHYTNLQPLWAADNIRKSDKVVDNEQ